LERAGIARADVVEAGDHKATFAAFKDPSGIPDFAVIDWDLPELDAPALVQHLRASFSGRIGVLFCVKPADRDAVSKLPSQGPFERIERPFADAAFLEKVQIIRQAAEKARADEGANYLRAIASGKDLEPALPFLLQIPSHLIDELLKKAARRRHAPGTVLMRPEVIPEALHIVTRGEVEILEGTAGIQSRVSGEGDPYGELGFMTGRPAGETVRARSEVEVASVSRAELSDVLRRHPRMADYLSSLLSRHTKAMATRATTLSHADFKGTLDATPFADLIQLLGSTRKTGVLGFRDEARAGAIYLEDGEAIHAWTETLQGEEAFFELANWRRARFAFRSIRRQEPRTLKTATMTLLLEAMRRLGDSENPTEHRRE
jgi:two-component system chemotaxis response regulator CheY